MGCPNHEAAEALIADVLASFGIEADVRAITVPDVDTAERLRFPGSPTIRVDGEDIEPGYEDPGEWTLRCRVYRTAAGLRGLPERAWLVAALMAGGQADG